MISVLKKYIYNNSFFKLMILFLFVGTLANANENANAPKRIIALSPAIVELMYTLGFENKIVGASEFADFPEAAKKIPVVGPYTKPSLERIVQLKPDLVLIPIEGPADIKRRFDQLKIRYEVLSMRTLDEIGSTAKQIASLVGEADVGIKFEKNWSKQLIESFSTKKVFTKSPHVLLEVEHSPLIIAGQMTFLHEILEKCGGENIFKDLKGYPRISKELLFNKKIDLILLADHFSNEQTKTRALNNWKSFLPTKNTRLVVLSPDITTRPGPRLLEGIKIICGAL
ncbi:MAG: helical backbone metal receptor [Oligoflexia bacterium]|nr:helical backbone metal receptor [Oligoflexia bacterium]